jgi:hypothetical protein
MHNSKCKGIGFATLDSKVVANKLIKCNNIYCKNRQLRFTRYKSDKHNKYVQTSYIKVLGIPEYADRNWLLTHLGDFSIKRCYIDMNTNTGQRLEYGVLELDDTLEYDIYKTKYRVYDSTGEHILRFAKYDD